MDRLESLSTQLSQISMYDIKSMYQQAKNVVLNVSEIEAKVQEATNEDPWGASSTLMQDIANRTFNYPDFNEIMPSIYARFMEKEARQWRQIYKALQLLEYLIKNGSERVVDDARAHISTVKMLRNFHYIDDKGKDQGINVRNRSKEIVELLSDVEKIRTERRKAKANKNKYTGTGSDGMSFSGGGSGGRYGGFGSDSLGGGGFSGGSMSGVSDHYNSSYNGGGSGGRSSTSFRDDNRRGGGFEEYNAGDDETVTSAPARSNSMNTTSSSRSTPARKASVPTPAPAPKVPEVDLLGGLDDDTFNSPAPVTAPTVPASSGSNKALPTPGNIFDDDDFDSFQTAPTGSAAAAPAPAVAPVAPANQNLMAMLNQGGASHQRTGSLGMQQPMGAAPNVGMGMQQPMRMGSLPMTASPPPQNLWNASGMMQPAPVTSPPPMSMTPTSGMRPTSMSKPATPKPASSGNFDDLWSMSLGSSSKPSTPVGGKSMKALQSEKVSVGLWGGAGGAKPAMGNSNAFGSFGTSTTTSKNGSGGDDLLL
ncbi:ENTH-domain-containing protein [Cylindrobasidium torrendii FP15055 ss-10]|uniref:ENTH-domain-containing protein n=1 Tax=Cylindrobasidium torrendii FP15055 ss-10 TaxID=1314674 RepID=A0A0D7BFJ7_9AGAR|nr:ENTH-domain-containing protein [Cylindrobasidium torrendii FP15055 ss-10]